MFKKIFLFNALALIALLPNISLARDVSKINDWYLKDFHSDILVNTDSSLLITEKIIADCGNLAGKHGIFRVLPTQINTSEGKILTPIELVSITDYAGQPLKYSTTKQNNTITWKIGDPDITVKGENTYQIVYKVKNAIRFQENFEELWWNLNGNFWELETDNYTADIHFPEAISQDNTQIDYYTGLYGSKDKNLAIWEWQDKVLHFQSADILRKGEGISISVSMPKNIFTPYQITFSDKYPSWPWLAWPILTFIFCFTFWKKHGKDPHWHKTVIAEYEVPDNLTPMQMSMLSGLGILNNKAISGSIIKLACDGIIKKTIRGFLEENSYVEKNKYFSKVFLYSFGIYFIFLVFFLFFSGAVVFSLLIVFFFSLLMNKRTMKGAEAEWRVRGFKLFISTAEKYRARFYEKENMFEKILPYAIAFGLTDKWVKAMKDIYGAEKFAAMTPVWFIGSGANFDIDNFFSALTSMTSAISQSASSSTGAGGGGFSGGGGGGGGGGGW